MNHQPKTCSFCGEAFVPKRRNRKFCSDTCKQYNYLCNKTGKRYGQETIQQDEKQALLITEQGSIPELSQTIPSVINITYEYLSRSSQTHPPNEPLLRKWCSSISG